MKKIYLLFIFIGLVCLSFSSGIQAQSNTVQKQDSKDIKIEQLRIFPNPMSEGSVLYITSKLGLTKQVSIYSVLGKRIHFKVLVGKKLDISHLKSGVYIVKVKEGDKEATKKLIIKN
ncbi:T9SS type A sorting domain-containing protein [Aquimarina sp. 2304DJ70-9]|uniref:T9SS type A sorting domain-containing protein n=1 Tax=Aquimarina penaris TaxID=3231044 RepID=UPI0034625EB2